MSRTSNVIMFIAGIILLAGVTLYFLLGDPEELRPLFQTIADPIASVLRIPGDILRSIVLEIPLWVARVLFIIYYLAIFVWAFQKDKSEVQGDVPEFKRKLDIRIFIALSLSSLILVYILW